MSNYIKTVNFATKDALPSGNAAKVVKGTEIDTEYNNIATAVATKQDTSSLGVANGYAPLDSGARVPVANLPTNTAYRDQSLHFTTVQTFDLGIVATGQNSTNSAVFNSATGTGTGFGPLIRGGTNSSDYALAVQNAAASVDFLRIFGSGAIQFGNTTGNPTFSFLGTGAASFGGNLTVQGNTTLSGTCTASVFGGSGASLNSLPAGQLTGSAPASVLGTGATPSRWLFLSGSTPTWSQIAFSDLLSGSQISTAQVPAGVVTQYNSSITGRNISSKAGVSKTLQAGGTASGGSDGDIIYIY